MSRLYRKYCELWKEETVITEYMDYKTYTNNCPMVFRTYPAI